MWAVETHGLSKSYGNAVSLSDCDLQIASGCVFGLLGPNGAGKTTLLRTLLGFIRPTRGSATICGFDISAQPLQARRQVSYLPGDARLMRSMRGRQLLQMFSGLHPYGSRDSSMAVAERLELDLSKRVMFMSTGMRQKLAIAIVLGCRAPVLVLDEPTANLDPNVRGEVMTMVQEVRQQGRTVLLSSHIFSDIDETCDHVAILRSGRVVVQQEMSRLQQTHLVTGRLPARWRGSPLAWQAELSKQPCLSSLRRIGGEEAADVEFQLSGDPQNWLGWLAQIGLEDLQLERAGIRAVYQRFHRQAQAS